MIPIILAILSLGILVIIHEAGHFIVARLCKMRVDKFSLGFGPAIWKKKIGETTYQVGAVPLGGFVQIAGLTPDEEGNKATDPNDPHLYNNRPAWQRFLAVLAGPAINYLFAILVLVGLNLTLGVHQPVEGAMVKMVQKNMPAAQAGMKSGDDLISINQVHVKSKEQAVDLVKNSNGKPIHLVIVRKNKEMSFDITPVFKEGRFMIGFEPDDKTVRMHIGVIPAIHDGVLYPFYATAFQLKKLGELFTSPKLSFKEKVGGMGGPVGIIGQMKEQMSSGPEKALEAMVMLSIALGMFNLFPLPALDGGRLVFLGIEIISRRPVNQRIEQIVHVVGFLLLLALLLLVTIKDIYALFQH